MYAVIKTGGKQYRVKEGDRLKVEKLALDVGATVDLEVLLVGEGGGVKLGAPLVDGAKVSAEVVSHGKHRKLWHFRTQEEGWDRIRGHRQPYTELKITGISDSVGARASNESAGSSTPNA
jgi:large subunit ribosomal protein L21